MRDEPLNHKGWVPKNWCFQTLVLKKRLLRVPQTAKRSNQWIQKEINSEYSLEGLMLKLKLLILWPPNANSPLIRKDPDAGKNWRQEEKGTDRGWDGWMASPMPSIDGHESEQALGVGDGQGGLACCSPQGRRVGQDWATEVNWTY